MKVRDVMSSRPDYLNADASIREAARCMRELDCGFVPLADNDKLVGIVTDRDLTIRALADGRSPDERVSSIETQQVLYCAEDDDITDVLRNMHEQHVQRLIVLNDRKDKDFVGVISLADIADHASSDPQITEGIVNCCRHYH